MLGFWLISSVICLFALYITALAMAQQIKREGYTVKKTNVGIAEIIRGCLVFFIPFLNLVLTMIVVFFYDGVYDAVIKILLEKGQITKPEL